MQGYSKITSKSGRPCRRRVGGVVSPGRAADLLARTHGQVAIGIFQLLEQLGPALTQLHD